MKSQKTYNAYLRYLRNQFSLGHSQQKASKNFSKRFNVSLQYADIISYKFYNQFLNKLKKESWPIVNL